MRVLLILPPLNRKAFGRWHRLMQPMPSVGMASIAAVLEREGCTVRAIDMFADGMEIAQLAPIMKREQPDIVGVTVLTPAAPAAEAICREVRKHAPRAVIVLGGIHASLFADEILKAGYSDIVVHEEGEEAISEIRSVLSGGGSLGEVAGISFLDNGRVRSTPKRPANTNLDSLPFPAWHLFPYRKYGLLPFADIARPMLTISGSRGCPYRCDYCSLQAIGKVYRKRSPASIAEELDIASRRYGARQVGFVDPIFPLDLAQIEALCEEFLRRRIPERLVWVSETRCDVLDRRMLGLMYRAGCRRVFFGMESGVTELLDGVHKRSSIDRNRVIVRQAREEGIQTVGLFMLGLPGETPAQTARTIQYALDVGVDFAKFAVTVPFPGSKLYNDMKKTGLDRTDWENYTTFNPDPDKLVLATNTQDGRELLRQLRLGTMRFYLRPRTIARQLLQIRTVSVRNIIDGLYAVLY